MRTSGRWLVEAQDADSDRADRADPAPHGIGRAHRDGARGDLEQPHADRDRGEEGERPRQIAEAVHEPQRGGEPNFKKPTNDQPQPRHDKCVIGRARPFVRCRVMAKSAVGNMSHRGGSWCSWRCCRLAGRLHVGRRAAGGMAASTCRRRVPADLHPAARNPRQRATFASTRGKRRQPHVLLVITVAVGVVFLPIASGRSSRTAKPAADDHVDDHRHARRSPGCSATPSTRSITRTWITAGRRAARRASISRDTKEPGYWDFVYFAFTLG